MNWKSWYFPNISNMSIPPVCIHIMNALIEDKAIKIFPDTANYTWNKCAYISVHVSEKDVPLACLEKIFSLNL